MTDDERVRLTFSEVRLDFVQRRFLVLRRKRSLYLLVCPWCAAPVYVRDSPADVPTVYRFAAEHAELEHEGTDIRFGWSEHHG